MFAPLGKRSGRKSSQVRNICSVCEHENCGRRKVRKHKEIKGSDKIVTLNISAKFDSLNNMKTTSSESKGKLGRSGKGLVTALAFKTKVRFAKIQKGKACHRKCQREGPFEDYQRV